MSTLLKKKCCCLAEPVCFYIAVPCPCDEGAVNVAVLCSEVTTTIIFAHMGICYQVSPIDPVTSTELEVVSISATFVDCDACCSQKECFYHYVPCPCSSDAPDIYILCSDNPPPLIRAQFDQFNPCYQQSGQVFISGPPPGPVVFQFVAIPDCDECCSCPEAQWCEDECLDGYSVNVGGWTVPSDPCVVAFPQTNVPVERIGGCLWRSPQSGFGEDCHEASINCPGFPPIPINYKYLVDQLHCADVGGAQWFLTITVSGVDCPNGIGFTQQIIYCKPASETSCPNGGYIKCAGPADVLPESVTVV